MSDKVYIRNTAEEEVFVQFDGAMHRWGHRETKAVPKELSNHMLRWGLNSAGQPCLEQLTDEDGGGSLAESELATAQAELTHANELASRAKENVAAKERKLKMARAKRDAYLRENTAESEAAEAARVEAERQRQAEAAEAAKKNAKK